MTETGLFTKPDRRRPGPLWHQAGRAIRELIADGTWQDGTQIPNEERLSRMLGVSRITTRHALRDMEESGLLRREHGRGTFVRSSRVIAGVRGLTSFTQEMANLGLTVGSQVLELAELPATPEVAHALTLKPGAATVKLRRLRLGNAAPIGIQTVHMPAERVPGFVEVRTRTVSLYETLRTRYGIAPHEAREVYRVDTAAPDDAELLEVAAGSPVFLVERVTSDTVGAFEFTVSVMRGDRYEIRSKLHL